MVACAIIATLLVSGSVMAYIYYTDNFPKRISALEARRVADMVARTNNVTMPLCSIHAVGWPQTGDVDERGESTVWSFFYEKVNRANDTWETVVITVHAEGEPGFFYRIQDAIYAHSIYALDSFELDSTTAYMIALESPAVKKYRLEHSGEHLEAFGVVFNPDYGRIVWGMAWRDEGFMDNPSHCMAIIDANDGSVLAPHNLY